MDELNFAILTSLLTAVKSIFDNSLGFYMRKKQTYHLLSSFLSPDGDTVDWSSADSYSMLFFFFNSVAELRLFWQMNVKHIDNTYNAMHHWRST